VKYRKLRIAWSVAWGVVAVLVCALWVRSSERSERFFVGFTNKVGVHLESSNGQLHLSYSNWSDEPNMQLSPWAHYYDRRPAKRKKSDAGIVNLFHSKNQTYVGARHWIVILLCGAAMTAPWLPRRFSLRTLLIATTLVALLLGLFVWLR
jgi:hypothetical protein